MTIQAASNPVNMHSPIKSFPYRYSHQAFPAYAYVPGCMPHPTRDPEGHSYNQHPADPPTFGTDEWQDCEAYLYGIDLFNHGYWWEAHESLEAVWHTAGRNTETGQFIQGLIQIAAAHLKKFQGFTDVAERMSADGLSKMKQINVVYLGIDVPAFRNKVIRYFRGEDTGPVTIELVNMDKVQ